VSGQEPIGSRAYEEVLLDGLAGWAAGPLASNRATASAIGWPVFRSK
jgi:hypothetical protein